MPTNLNALIRYKTIDRCLNNGNAKWTIERLQEECTEALGEARGVYKRVSERTIRDDIRVMRSDILEFNAPIVVKNGFYRYSIPYFSIFRSEISEIKLLQTVFEILVKNKDAIKHRNLYDVVEELAALTNNKVPVNMSPPVLDDTEIRFSFVPESKENDEPDITKVHESDQDSEEGVSMIFEELHQYKLAEPQRKRLYFWSDILNIISK